MKIETITQITHVSVVLTRPETARLYWALADVVGPASERDAHPGRRALYELFDELYEAGAQTMSQKD